MNQIIELRPSIVGRFFSKIQVSQNGCWEWQDHLDSGGYGRFRLGKEKVKPHRLSYEMYVGELLEWPEYSIDHLCRNRACVHPLHLEQVKHTENIRRGLAGHYNKIKTHCANGHEFTEENTLFSGGRRSCRACNREKTRRYREKRKS